jgi:beta-glucosidase
MRDPSYAGGDCQPTRGTLFLFANSYPTIQNGRVRRDRIEECGHYDHRRRPGVAKVGDGTCAMS